MSRTVLFDEQFIHRMLDIIAAASGNPRFDETYLKDSIRALVRCAVNGCACVCVHYPVPSTIAFIHAHRQLVVNEQALLQRTATNPVMSTLRARLESASSFGQQLIHMLNDECIGGTAGDVTLKIQALKLLFLLFEDTSPGLAHFFYLNDLKVLVDVFVRDLQDLPEMEMVISVAGAVNLLVAMTARCRA